MPYSFTPHDIYPAPATEDVWDYPEPNVRLVCSHTSDTTVYMPEHPEDGARMGFADIGMTGDLVLDGNGRLIEGSSDIVISPPVASRAASREWIYRADKGDWLRVTEVGENSVIPLPAQFDMLLICLLNMRLSPRHGRKTSPETVATTQAMMTKLKARYRQTTAKLITRDNGLRQSYDNGWGF